MEQQYTPPTPEQKKSSNKKVVIILLCCFGLLVLCFGIQALNSLVGKKDTVKKDESKFSYTPEKELSKYEKGIKNFNEGSFTLAKAFFEDIKENDSNYTNAQEQIKICEEKIIEKEKERDRQQKEYLEKDKKKSSLQKKYEKVCNSGGYKYEIENKLHRLDFKQVDSGFEKSPDGSTQVATYYNKYEDGFNIKIRLISGYDLSTFYYDVTVE